MRYELVIRGTSVYDGMGNRPFMADVAVDNGRIAAVSRLFSDARLNGSEVVDGTGLALAPGFIDFHSHSEWVLPQADQAQILTPLVEQGITTILGGNCGFVPAPVTDLSAGPLLLNSDLARDDAIPFSWHTHKEYLDWLDQRPLALNLAMLAGHGSIRLAVMGEIAQRADGTQMKRMAAWGREALQAGFFGISYGLGYAPGMYAARDELDALAREVAEADALLPMHVRAYTAVSPFLGLHKYGFKAHNILAIEEFLDLVAQHRVRAQLSHLIFVGRSSWRTHQAAIRAMERARDDGLDVAFDSYPYTAGNTTIRAIYPKWAQDNLADKLTRPDVRARLRLEALAITKLIRFDLGDIQLMWSPDPEFGQMQGMRFGDIGKAMGLDAFGAYMECTRRSDGVARIMIFQYSGDDANETALRKVLAHPLNIMETDVLLTRLGHQNPASYGAFPRFLGHYCRDQGLLSLAEGIEKCTSLAARRMGLCDRGEIRVGNWADLVLFDAALLDGPADFSAPDRRPIGIHQVYLNGQRVVDGGRMAEDRLCGRVLRRT